MWTRKAAFTFTGGYTLEQMLVMKDMLQPLVEYYSLPGLRLGWRHRGLWQVRLDSARREVPLLGAT